MGKIIYKKTIREYNYKLDYEEDRLFQIQYNCPICSEIWEDVHSSACDATCPKCDTKNIEALSYKEIKPIK